MPYTRVWDLAEPDGSEPALTLGEIIRNLKDDLEERINTILGKPIGTPFADPIIDFYDAGNSGANKQIDWANGPIQLVTMTDNCTFTFVNQVNGRPHVLIMLQDGVGGRTAALTDWDFGANPFTPDTTANFYNAVTGLYVNSQYLGAAFCVGAS